MLYMKWIFSIVTFLLAANCLFAQPQTMTISKQKLHDKIREAGPGKQLE